MNPIHNPSGFAPRLVAWQLAHGRHDLPWQTGNPYHVWVSEVMLQQTQVSTVRDYFCRFVARFPDIPSLARADEEEVLALWAGLGYYRRARHLQAAAGQLCARHAGRLPVDAAALTALPGIGRSTAGAILSLGFGQPAAILDGNARRVFVRYAALPGCPRQPENERQLWRTAEALLPTDTRAARPYTQGLMDLGALICSPRQPRCASCPVADGCLAHASAQVNHLPEPCRRRPLPRRRRNLLVLFSGGRVLLERRPATGVWPGLWSLPEEETEIEPDGLPLAGFRHRFTHFELDARPWLRSLETAHITGAKEAETRLVAPCGPLPPVPAPIQRFLRWLARQPEWLNL